ncbi:MAG: endonuclease domain-containing protein [Chryseolinea sp.]
MSLLEIHFGAGRKLFQYARENRKPLTRSERKLWNCIRNKKLKGFKFRRQHPIANYIADFFCWQCKLVIEVDGGYHHSEDQQKLDDARDKVLKESVFVQ